jgi:hypothetical protein
MGSQSNCLTISLVMLLAAAACVGCSHTGPKHVPLSERLFPHDDRYWEFGFYGHHPTCWQQWPAEWVGCPHYGALEYPVQPVEVLPSGPVNPPPPAANSPQQTEPPSYLPAPGAPPAPALPEPNANDRTREPVIRMGVRENRSSVQLIGMSPSQAMGMTPKPLAEILGSEPEPAPAPLPFLPVIQGR